MGKPCFKTMLVYLKGLKIHLNYLNVIIKFVWLPQVNDLLLFVTDTIEQSCCGFNADNQFCPQIGICGRTGSGKSSLVMSLFHMISVSQGKILIDEVDLMTIPLKVMRSRLSIIPQDVIMFTGTIRYLLININANNGQNRYICNNV